MAATSSPLAPVPAPQLAAQPTTAPAKLDRLALLYEGILTAIVRVQNGSQQMQDVELFRSRMKQALREIADTAARRGYAQEDVREAEFAVVAFLDEMVLSSQDASRTQWARKSMGEELFEQRSAGELFFRRLEALRANRDSQELAEVLEVYYLCLLLGYEGRYAGGSRTELQLLMSNVRDRIDRIFGRQKEFSPDAALPPDRPPQVAVDPLRKQLKVFAVSALIFALLCFIGFRWHLASKVDDIERSAQERTIP
jgi:type VI secretion system protein ImpK